VGSAGWERWQMWIWTKFRGIGKYKHNDSAFRPKFPKRLREEIPHEMRKIPHGIFTIFWTMIGALKKIRAGRRRFFCALTRHREDGSDVKSKITNKNPIFTAKVTIPKNVFYQYLKTRKSWYVTFLYLALIQIFRIRLYTAIKYKRV
jgi:hypothetical protein